MAPPGVRFTGFEKRREALASALASADVLVHGCPFETFGLGVAEAVACGLPVVAPDEGALERCEAVRLAAGIDAPVAHLRKRRDAGGVSHSALVGEVEERVALVDDILDTGGTLLSACDQLRRSGVHEIFVFATHGLFTGERWRELPSLGVRRIFTTDSVPTAARRGGDLVQVLPAGEMIMDAFAAMALQPSGGSRLNRPHGNVVAPSSLRKLPDGF